MFPSEMVVLMAMAATRQSITGSLGWPGEFQQEVAEVPRMAINNQLKS